MPKFTYKETQGKTLFQSHYMHLLFKLKLSKHMDLKLPWVFACDFYFVGGIVQLLAAVNVPDHVTQGYFSVTMHKHNISCLPKL